MLRPGMTGSKFFCGISLFCAELPFLQRLEADYERNTLTKSSACRASEEAQPQWLARGPSPSDTAPAPLCAPSACPHSSSLGQTLTDMTLI